MWVEAPKGWFAIGNPERFEPLPGQRHLREIDLAASGLEAEGERHALQQMATVGREAPPAGAWGVNPGERQSLQRPIPYTRQKPGLRIGLGFQDRYRTTSRFMFL